MRRALIASACASLVLVPSQARANEVFLKGVIIVVPFDIATTLVARLPAAEAVGVFPGTTSPREFIEEVGRGSPGRGDGFALDRGLAEAGILITATTYASARGSAIGTFADLFRRASATQSGSGGVVQLEVVIADSMQDVEAHPLELLDAGVPGLIIGIGARAPMLVALTGTEGVLEGGIARRPGVATPYDIAATIMDMAGIAVPSTFTGHPLHAAPSRPEQVASVRARLLRDVGFGPGFAKATAGFALGGVFFAMLLVRRRGPRAAERFVRATALVPLGYLGSLFIPSGDWKVRALGLVVPFAAGLAWPARSTRRFCGVVLLGTSILIGLLTILAALRPDAEPALSLWGNPLNSWRFFGLRNHLAAFVAGGIIVGPLLLGARKVVLVIAAAGAAFLIGAPFLGANFIAVLTLTFGATLALLVLSKNSVRVVQVIVSMIIATLVTALAFAADAGSPVSHGGRAARSIGNEGIAAAWRLFSDRARLNYREVADIGFAGFIAFGLLVIVLAAMFVWAYRARSVPAAIRAAIAGSSAAAFAAVFVEDSGFFTGGILGLYPWIALAIYLLATPTDTEPARG